MRSFAPGARLATLLATALLLATSAHAVTLTVDTATDTAATDDNLGNGVCHAAGGGCPLRAAVGEANALAGTDAIEFAIGTGDVTIVLTSSIEITEAVTINGTTQPSGATCGDVLNGSAQVLRVTLDGQGTATFTALEVSGDNVTISGLKFVGWGEGNSGPIVFNGSADSGAARCNRITDNATGTGHGIVDLGTNTTIEDNVIGGCQQAVVLIPSSGAPTNTIVRGNLIGFDGAALGSDPNIEGVAGEGARTATITENVIGNNDSGIRLRAGGQPQETTAVTITKNKIGVGPDGTATFPNAKGILLEGATDGTLIGGTSGDRNIVSANTTVGISVGASVTDTTIAENYVGVLADGTTEACNDGGGTVGDIVNSAGAETTLTNNVTCPEPNTNGCCNVTGVEEIFTCIDINNAGQQMTSLEFCQAGLDGGFGEGVANATSFNADALCDGGVCPAVVDTPTATATPTATVTATATITATATVTPTGGAVVGAQLTPVALRPVALEPAALR